MSLVKRRKKELQIAGFLGWAHSIRSKPTPLKSERSQARHWTAPLKPHFNAWKRYFTVALPYHIGTLISLKGIENLLKGFFV